MVLPSLTGFYWVLPSFTGLGTGSFVFSVAGERGGPDLFGGQVFGRRVPALRPGGGQLSGTGP